MNIIKNVFWTIRARKYVKDVYEYEYVAYYGRTPKQDARLCIKRKIYRMYTKIANIFKKH